MAESTRKTRQRHKYKVSPGIKDCEIVECNSTERSSLNSDDLDEVLNFIKTCESSAVLEFSTALAQTAFFLATLSLREFLHVTEAGSDIGLVRGMYTRAPRLGYNFQIFTIRV